ncbi:hypothetical protein PHYBLDRAFT_142163 [Phycomyces blakesleeanus NRRL 1555(-)]|uniref:Uncharacterized protein n=1 Tax=Phycomyces blakesleeanus (strain ATCC 8743b / DSM 1359 / FGSC 10004 / NBRC 33097 / NRRL 1555) TaxID=763407 RepID=A0A167NUN0_PHYB8|nr:hypothetical protein PHYBLDRAFT_142163 [Phycomyces blakesleeanus NRRL 1555(-)]OAD76649.1 hypothetical protein PHYBLDRAFT_142163 [Phycomyces blakesleeanus NRRL 1555(-)]|eukprot:XP_018294689.1 hypothetical protein PHYBLDRAFT_142163 [Phycomyces blakesleeanus NRRL 1555(-)]
MSTKTYLENELRAAKVLNSELKGLRSSAALYERHVPSSNIFFLADDKKAVQSAAKKRQDDLENMLGAAQS